MLSLYIKAKDLLHRIHTGEAAQDAFEYMLVVGGVSVAVVFAIVTAPGLIDPIITAVIAAIDTVLDVVPAP